MVYGEYAPSYDVVKYWNDQFKCRRTSEGTVPIHVHPLTAINDATIPQIETVILEDCCVTERQLVHAVKISLGSVEIICEGKAILKQ